MVLKDFLGGLMSLYSLIIPFTPDWLWEEFS